MVRRGFLLAVALVMLIGGAPAGASGSPHEADRRTDRDKLAAATHCDRSLTTGATRRAVLLVHGTGATPEEAWSWNYAIALRRAGYGVCTVRLPGRALVDLGRSARYVAHAARVAYRASERKIAIIGHSQGALLGMWVPRFWPDVARHTSDVIGLAGPLRGTALANTLCLPGRCAKVAWQMRRRSRFVKAFNLARAPRAVDQTSIGTRQDEIVFPQPAASTMSGGATVMVQDLCPARVADHGLMLADSAGYALVLDALRHPGPARVARVDRTVCSRPTLPGTDLAGSVGFAGTLVSLSLGLASPVGWVAQEPPVPAYAR